VSISRPRCARERISRQGSGIPSGPLAHNKSAAIDGLFRDGNARPGGHLNAGDQKVLAVLGTEDRRVTLLHLEPSLAERVDDVRLIRNQNYAGAVFRRCRPHRGEQRRYAFVTPASRACASAQCPISTPCRTHGRHPRRSELCQYRMFGTISFIYLERPIRRFAASIAERLAGRLSTDHPRCLKQRRTGRRPLPGRSSPWSLLNWG
jgi:hypothetical protein